MDTCENLAAQFAGETGIPISSLGVIHDNPASAEAIYAAKEDLIIEAEGLNETNGAALRNIGLLVAAISANTTIDALPDNAKKMQPRFRNPAIPSVVSQSDAIIKQVSAIPWIAESQVALEELGYTESQITRLLSDKRKFQSRKALEALMASGNGNGVKIILSSRELESYGQTTIKLAGEASEKFSRFLKTLNIKDGNYWPYKDMIFDVAEGLIRQYGGAASLNAAEFFEKQTGISNALASEWIDLDSLDRTNSVCDCGKSIRRAGR
ncbi:phage portal protein [Eubacterium limosum]|nr:phage portal protein [Eubacterium limosum]